MTRAKESRIGLRSGIAAVVAALTVVACAASPDVAAPARPSASQDREPCLPALASDARDALAPLRQHARAAGLAPESLRPACVPEILGLHLTGDGVRVVPDGVLRLVADEETETAAAHAEARRALGVAIRDWIAWLPRSGLSPVSRRALAAVVGRTASVEVDPDFDPTPDFTRRLLRHGWLADLDSESLRSLRRAVREAEELRPVRRFAGSVSGAQLRYAVYRDAFGNDVWELVTPERSRYMRALPAPAYLADDVPDAARLRLVVDVAAAASPLGAEPERTAASVHLAGRRLASWDASRGFEADAARWRASLPRAAGADRFLLENAFPPHVLVVARNGDPLELFTAHGRVVPTRERGRFLAEAAGALPDAAHLDLIGEHLFRYVYDSPDLLRPDLVGTATYSSDIHQTPEQVLATLAGGTYRGDCDDLSELYQAIALRQGQLAHVIGLPEHAAAAWAERGEGSWTTHVLQTGPPRALTSDTLTESLTRVYASFDYGRSLGAVFNPQSIEVLLRFPGDNTRSEYRLAERIFADPAYARDMLDIQADWHFWTFSPAIAKVRRRIVSGDRSAAMLNELAMLYDFTNAYERAAEYQGRAVEASSRLPTRVDFAVSRVRMLLNAGREEEADALVRELVGTWIPALSERGEDRIAPVILLANEILGSDRGRERALDVLTGEALETLERSEYWFTDAAEESQLTEFMRTAVEVLRLSRPAQGEPPERWKRLSQLVGQWFREQAFASPDPGRLLSTYASLAVYYEATLGPDVFDALIAEDAAVDPGTDHRARGRGAEQVWADLGWIQMASGFWLGRLDRLFERGRTHLDRKRVAELADRVEEAVRLAASHGLASVDSLDHRRASRLVRSMVLEDRAGFRRVLREVALERDRRSYASLAERIAAAARFVPVARFRELMAITAEEIDYPPLFFRIAWHAVWRHGAAQALEAARRGAQRHPDVPAFAEEYAYMRSRFAAPAKATPPLPSTGASARRSP